MVSSTKEKEKGIAISSFAFDGFAFVNLLQVLLLTEDIVIVKGFNL